MVIITWMQRGAKGAAAYTMRAVIKPITERDVESYAVERAHTDATGGMGWVPARHTHMPAIVCMALLTIGERLTEFADSLRGRDAATAAEQPLTIYLGLLDLPEPG